jgi:hypothetical protein
MYSCEEYIFIGSAPVYDRGPRRSALRRELLNGARWLWLTQGVFLSQRSLQRPHVRLLPRARPPGRIDDLHRSLVQALSGCAVLTLGAAGAMKFPSRRT